MLQLPALDGFTDVAVFGDGDRPRTFYVVPAVPRIRRDETGRPMLVFLKYRTAPGDETDSAGGGFLSFQTELGLSEAQRLAITGRLMAPDGPAHGASAIELAAPTYLDGAAELMTFAPRPGGIVEDLVGSAKPSLQRDLTASFDLRLSRDGATLMWDQLRKTPSPVAIRYRLTFLARLPAGRARIFLHAGPLRDAWAELGAIPAGPERQAALAARGIAGVEILDWPVGDASLTALRERVETWGWDLIQRSSSGPQAGGPGTDPGTPPTAAEDLDMVVDGRSAVPWTLQPQGNLDTMAAAADATGFREVDLTDPIFQHVAVRTRCNADFETDRIAAITVRLSYGQERHDAVFHDGSEVDAWEVVAKPPLGRAYAYRPVIQFQASSHTLELPEATSESPNLLVSTGPVGWVRLAVTSTVTWGAIDEVRIEVAYEDPDRGVARETATLRLTAAEPLDHYERAVWTLVDRPVSCQVSYVLHGGRVVQRPPFQHPSGLLVVPDLYADTLTVRFVLASADDAVKLHVVETRYDDAAGHVEHATLELRPDAATRTWAVPIETSASRRFSYRITTTFADGHATVDDWVDGDGSATIAVGAPAAFIDVEVFPDLLDFAVIRMAVVRLRHGPPDTTAPHSIVLVAGTTASQRWRAPLASGEPADYDWWVEYVLSDGSHRSTEPVRSSAPTIVVPPPPA